MSSIVHRYWSGPPDPMADDSGRALLELNPEATLVDWSPRSVPAAVRALIDATAGLVVDAHQIRHAANVVRLWALYDLGGVWVDHDVTCYAPFSVMPSPATAAHRNGHRCNCWLQFPSGHPALVEALSAIVDAPQGAAKSSTEVSGERLLQRLWGDEVQRVTVHRDIDGRVDPSAHRWFDHAGRTANAA